MRTAVLLLVLAAFAIFTVSASIDYVEVNERTEDRPGYVHTMSQPEGVMYGDAEEEYDSGLQYGPVKVWGVPLPEWAVTALKELGLNLPPREPLPVPHDAPISARAPIHLPHHYKGKVERLRRRSAEESEDFVEREWILIVKKAYRDDFVAVLEDMGKQLNERFGLQVSEWFDTRSLRESKRAHQERQLQRRAEGQPEEGPWRLDAEHDLGHRAFEFGKRMMVTIVIPVSLADREVEILEALRDMPWVESIEANKIMRTTATIVSQSMNSNANYYPWGLDRVDQRSLPLNQRYTYPDPTYNVVVYVIDTGIRATHQEFGGRATFGRNFIIGDTINTDCNGHGTHVSGIVAGNTMGLSKRVTIVGLKVLDCSGSGTSSSVANAISWAVSDCSGRSSQPKCLISLSLGSQATVSDTGVESALQNAYNSGLVVVTAAGNSNLDACTVSPARSPYGITVGATTTRDAKASFSNYGPCVDIWAPGVYIPSAYNSSDTAYQILSGTSQATPHVTGAAALFLGAVKNCTPSEVAGAILASSTVNQVTGTPTGTVNRLLYSLVDLADAPTTAQAACQRVQCNVTSSTLAALGSWNSDAFTVDSTTAAYGYFQVWLESSADLDLQLQYLSGGSSWTVLATSSGSSGEEWIQYSTSAKGAGQYRFYVTGASAADSGAFKVYYQVPGASQAGSPKTAAASSISAPFWLLPLFRGLLG